MSARKKINGIKFGKLIVIKETEKRNKNGSVYCLCKCECGNEIEIAKNSLISGNTKSCGCYLKEKRKQYISNYLHGESKTRLHTIWCEMKRRCYCKTDKAYNNYGGRGIKVCEEWKNNYLCFKEWAINNDYKENLTIDRINNDGDYEPNNCRWINKKQQANNRRTNIKIRYKNKEYTLKQLAELLQIKYSKIYWAYKNNSLYKYGIEIEEL